MNQEERMLAGLPYRPELDGLPGQRIEAKRRAHAFNNCPPENTTQANALLRNLLGTVGENLHIDAPFRCDYGKHIEIGSNFIAGANLTILDAGKVQIGHNVRFGANVTLCTSGYPIHPVSRLSGYEYAVGINIGSNVSLGCGVTVLPGVCIGNNVVVEAGSLVREDIPDNMLAAGNPCKVVCEITDDDRTYYYKDYQFDVSDY